MCVIPGRCVTCYFSLHSSSADAMGGDLEGINQYNINDETSLYTCKSPPPLEYSMKPVCVSSMASDNTGDEFNNFIVTDM